MDNDHLHFYLGLTRHELKKRLDSGELNLEAIKMQVDDYILDIRLQGLSEQWIDDHHEEQVERTSIDVPPASRVPPAGAATPAQAVISSAKPSKAR